MRHSKMASGIAGGGRRAGDAPPRLGLQGFRPAAFAAHAVPPRCFCGSWSSQSCAKRTPMSNTTERFPVLTGTGTRLHQTGFRMEKALITTRIHRQPRLHQTTTREQQAQVIDMVKIQNGKHLPAAACFYCDNQKT